MSRPIPLLGVEDRFLAKVEKTDGCWHFSSPRTDGYCQLWFDGKKHYAHRIAHELWVGPIPEGFEVDHSCNTRDCVNPANLHARAVPEHSGRHKAERTSCRRGHPWDEKNTYTASDGERRCRACNVINQTDHKRRART